MRLKLFSFYKKYIEIDIEYYYRLKGRLKFYCVFKESNFDLIVTEKCLSKNVKDTCSKYFKETKIFFINF